MKRILQVLVGLIVVVALAYWLLIDLVIERVIESEGSKQVKARVELDGVDFHLYPTSITLRGLQVTNPTAPMKNLIEAGQVSLDLDLKQVIERKIVADEMQLNQLRFNRDRAQSGAIPGLTPPPPAPTDYGLAGQLPSMSMADAKQMVAAEKERIQGELDRIENDFKTIEDRWKTKLDSLPDKDKVEEYKARAKALKEGNPLERLTGLNQLQKDLRVDLKTIDNLNDDLDSDLKTVQQQLDYVRNLPQTETQRLMAKAGISDASMDSVVKALFGPRIAELMAQGFAWYQQSQAAPAEPAPAASGGPEWLVLVKKTLVDGQLDIGNTQLGFDGTINNLTHQQALWKLPIDFTFNGSGGGQSQFSASGSVDHINPASPRDLVKFALTELPLTDLKLSDQPALNVTLAKAIADLSGSLSLKGDKVDMEVLSQFQQALLQTAVESDNQLAQAIAEALSSVQQFGIDLLVNGNINKPNLKLKSDLDRILSQAVGSQLKAQAGKLKGQLQEQLQAQLGPELKQLQDTAGQIQGLDQILGEREKALKDVVKL